MSEAKRIIGHPDELNLELFSATAAGSEVRIEQCDSCGKYTHPPVLYCPACFSGERSYTPVSGRGLVYSYTVSHYSVEKFWSERLPFLTVVVELDEGVRLVASARNLTAEQCRLGARVVVSQEAVADDFVVYWVDLDEGGAGS